MSVEVDRKNNEQPYPGLRYYRPDQDAVFAGRDREADSCARLVLRSNLTILHGLTGCGKSSFLRAGVRRRIEDAGLGINFEAPEDEGAFPVIRSTARPLRELMGKVLAACDDLHQNKVCSFGELRSGHEDTIAAVVEAVDVRRYCLSKKSHAMKVMEAFATALASRPILVIDQAEEVFTLVDAQGDPEERRKLEKERREYFDLLNRLALGGGPRIVVSLRTEYKGRFDDGIAADGGSGASVGFYLDELGPKGLVAAILSPTRDGSDWAGEGKSPFETFKFRYEEGVAEKLAESLADKNKVPSGGVLPTLQVACLRLWRHAVRNTRSGSVVVRRRHLNRLGDISRQIEVYLEESLEDSCAQIPAWTACVTEMVPELHRVLARVLVRRLPDGRAVSQSLSRSVVVERVEEALKALNLSKLGEEIRTEDVELLLNRLAREDVGILRAETAVSDSAPDGDQAEASGASWMLGHDSLALALHNWVGKHGASAPNMMMMMMGANTPDRFTGAQLFLEDEAPSKTKLFVLADYHWDRQIPIFGREYAERLGFEIVAPADLSAHGHGDQSKRARTWPELRRRMTEYADGFASELDVKHRKRAQALNAGADEASIRKAEEGFVHSRVLAAADWDSFSAFMGDVGKGSATPEEIARERGREAVKWSDLLVTSMSMGSGLVGAGLDGIPSLDTSSSLNPEALTDRIAEMLDRLVQKQAQFRVLDESGVNFLAFAAWLVNKPEFLDYIGEKDVIVPITGTEYAAEDPLVKWQSDGGDDRPRYFIGSAFARALATQSGMEVLFNAKHIAALCANEMDVRKSRSAGVQQASLTCSKLLPRPGSDQQRIGVDLAYDMQSIVDHTLWQVNIPAAQWRNGLNRAFILRLASVGYFTVEQVRSRMEAFIGHLHAYTNDILAKASDGARASRLYRDIVQSTVRDGFDFLRFDDYGERRYDLDSVHAYWSDHGLIGAKSVAGEIYQELSALRTQTLSHFNGVAHSIAWLRWSNRYDPTDMQIAEAYRLKELAWNNFRIFNFFDAERYMARAAAKLEDLVQKHGY